jgi:hypothetical protein
MFHNPILSRFTGITGLLDSKRSSIHRAFLMPGKLPGVVFQSPPVMRLLDLLGPLDWDRFPERNLDRNWGQASIPYSAFSAACLLKLNERLVSMAHLPQYLVEHPGFIWLLGFPLQPSHRHACGFDPEKSLPTGRHFTRMLRDMPNSAAQFIFHESVRLLLEHFSTLGLCAGDCISLDTKHILEWVKENNPKDYIEERFNKTKQPKGDRDCKLGCKRRHNQCSLPDTPTTNPVPASMLSVGEFYWGYGSGIVVVKVPDYGEFVLAEMTQTFDKPDVSYFFPLMAKTEQVLGFKPRFGTFDAAFDAWYVYDYFHRADDPQAFAAVPFSEKGGYKAKGRQFSPQGLPICAAGLEMPLKFAYHDQTTSIIPHERGKYVCPLCHPKRGEQVCPVKHPTWVKKGCTVTIPTSPGARLRYSLDRESQSYKEIYNQRTAVERIKSQACALGIERPHIRSGTASANLTTLTYALINLRLLQRLRQPG